MPRIKLYNVIIIILINLNKFKLNATDLSKLQNIINKELTYTNVNELTKKMTLYEFKYNIYTHLVQKEDQKVIVDTKLNLFFIFMNCSFGNWTHNELFKFIEIFPLLYQSKILNKYDNFFKKDLLKQVQHLNEIQKKVQNFIGILIYFLHLAKYRDYDTSLLKTMILLTTKIHFFTISSTKIEPPSDDVIIRSILGIINLIQIFYTTNCDVITPNNTYPDKRNIFMKLRNFSGFLITKLFESNNYIDNILKRVNNLELGCKECNSKQMLLVKIVAEHLEISNADVKTKFGTISIKQFLKRIEPHQWDLELLLLYQKSIFNTIVQLIYSKIITYLKSETIGPNDVDQIVKKIPKFIDLPINFKEGFKLQKYNNEEINALIEIITKIRNSITANILDNDKFIETPENSTFDKFILYLNSNSDDLNCFISVFKFLSEEFDKYYVPFLSDPLKIEHIIKSEDTPLAKNSQAKNDDNLSIDMCEYIRDLHCLCITFSINLSKYYKHTYRSPVEYANYSEQAEIGLTTIRELCIDVMARCTHIDCRDLIKVLYDLYVIMNPEKIKNVLLFDKAIMLNATSILNAYSNDHCYSPKFNFSLLDTEDFNYTGKLDVLFNKFNTFVNSLGTKQNTLMMSSYRTFLNIQNFYEHYVANTGLFTEEKYIVSFFWKGERRYFEQIYETINSTVVPPSHVFKLYDAYFKFVIGAVFYKIWVFAYCLLYNRNNRDLDLFSSDDCAMYQQVCQMILDDNNFPINLSPLVGKVRTFSVYLYNLCSEKEINSKEYTKIRNNNKNSKALQDLPEHDTTNSKENSNRLYTLVQSMIMEIGDQFIDYGTFIEYDHNQNMSINELLLQNITEEKLIVEKIFSNITEELYQIVVSANKMFTLVIANRNV